MNKKIKTSTFVTQLIFSRALQFYQNTLVRYLGSGYTPKQPTIITSAADDIFQKFSFLQRPLLK
jgi:hypothetical protein